MPPAGGQSDWQRLLPVLNRLLVLQPDAWNDYRDRGLAHAALGNSAQAVEDLEKYLLCAEDPLDIDSISHRINMLRRAKN